jgi:nucleoside-diphosphate-sugar epimerase
VANYLITGGAGFIGSNIAAELARGERTVEGVDYVPRQGGIEAPQERS